ncbi:MAG: hypothetical protein IT312_03365 [Anaerolineales bacterium]|nr:hypothetical protein [Anaerolineales bacterium]
MIVKPSTPKHKTEDLGDKLVVSIPSRKIFPFIMVFSIWSLIWLGGEISLIAAMFTSSTYNILSVSIVIVWFIFWTFLGAVLLYNLLWLLIGKEEIQITNQSITISQVVLGYKRSKEYTADYIKDLDIAWASMQDLMYRRISFPLGTSFGMIAFDYGARTFKFASGIEEAEAKQIIAKIQQKYPQYKSK